MCECMLGCNNGGGGGFFSKVKRLVAKWIGTRKRLFSGFLQHRWDFRNARTFAEGICNISTHICIFVLVHELLAYSRTLGFHHFASTLRSV